MFQSFLDGAGLNRSVEVVLKDIYYEAVDWDQCCDVDPFFVHYAGRTAN